MQMINRLYSGLNVAIFFLIIMLPMFFLSSVPVSAESLKIATIQLKPFGFFDKDKNSKGILYDLSSRIAKDAGFSYENRIVPYARVMKELADGTSDFSLVYTNDTLEKYALQVMPVMTFENIIIGLKGTKFDSLNALHGKKIAVVRGAKYDNAFSADKAIVKIKTYDYQQAVKILVRKRVDAIIIARTGFYFMIKQMGIPRDKFGVPLVVNTKDSYLHFSKKKADGKIISALKASAEKIKQNNIVQKIRDMYIMP